MNPHSKTGIDSNLTLIFVSIMKTTAEVFSRKSHSLDWFFPFNLVSNSKNYKKTTKTGIGM